MTQQEFDATTFDDLRKMTPEEFAVWAEWEPEPIALNLFPLGSDAGRRPSFASFTPLAGIGYFRL
jgi:hypothetical protein